MTEKIEKGRKAPSIWFAVCGNSGQRNIHPQPVAIPLRKDKWGSFYGACFCGYRAFYGKQRKKGLTYQEVLDKRIIPMAEG